MKTYLGELTRTPEGDWRYASEAYTAVVSAQDGLLSVSSDDSAGAYLGGEPARLYHVRCIDPVTVAAADGNIGLWWVFFPGKIVVDYAVNDATSDTLELQMPFGDERLGFEPGQRLSAQIVFASEPDLGQVKVDFLTDAPSHVFSGGKEVEFATVIDSSDAIEAEIAVLFFDSLTQEVLSEASQNVRIAPGGQSVNWSVPCAKAGVFDGSVRVRVGGKLVGWRDFTFVYDLENWRPPLYRPSDFWEFWTEQLSAMRELPLDPVMTLDEESSTESYQVYNIEITGAGGRRIRGRCGEPTTDDRFPVVLHSPHPGKDFSGGERGQVVQVGGEMEDVARYRKDVHDRYKSNFLHVFLDYIRWLDFADTRGKADWDRCYAPAGSRGGPIVIAAAALDDRIKLITMNVPTCNRWDWQVKYTGGWGPWLSDAAPGQSLEEFIRELSYFDPSHFAERVRITVASSWGMRDDLSPLAGQLSMWSYLAGRKHLELRPWGGHDEATEEFWKLCQRLPEELFESK